MQREELLQHQGFSMAQVRAVKDRYTVGQHISYGDLMNKKNPGVSGTIIGLFDYFMTIQVDDQVYRDTILYKDILMKEG